MIVITIWRGCHNNVITPLQYHNGIMVIYRVYHHNVVKTMVISWCHHNFVMTSSLQHYLITILPWCHHTLHYCDDIMAILWVYHRNIVKSSQYITKKYYIVTANLLYNATITSVIFNFKVWSRWQIISNNVFLSIGIWCVETKSLQKDLVEHLPSLVCTIT